MSAAAPSNAAPADLIELGRITAAYGIKGWVKVQPHSAQAEVLLTASEWWLTRPVPESARGVVASGPVAYKVLQSVPRAPRSWRSWRALPIAIWPKPCADFPCRPRAGPSPRPKKTNTTVDLIGCALYTNANGEPALIGVVDEVFDNGAHAVLKVLCQREGADGPEAILNAKGKPADMLVPFVRAHILSVDLAARRIDSDWPLDL